MNTKYLLIENRGEIDINALILMGGSTKRDSNTSIGFFGSGNKYSIALLLKKNIGFKVFSGAQELKITTKDVSFRDKSFKQILINEKETSLTPLKTLIPVKVIPGYTLNITLISSM